MDLRTRSGGIGTAMSVWYTMQLLRWLITLLLIGSSLGDGEKLFVKYGSTRLDPRRIDSFFELPRMRSDAEKRGWAVAEDRLATDGVSVLCRRNDYRVCLLMDVAGSVAGVQVAISVDDVKNTASPYPMDPNPMQERKSFLGTEVYAATVLFVGQDVLKSSGRKLSAATQTAPDGMYFLRRDAEPRFVPRSEDDLDGLFRKQACINGMGRHYFYNLTSDYECGEAESFYPFYDEQTHQLAGVGFMAYVRSSTQRHGRHWFELSDGPHIKIISPDAPECLSNWVDSYGLTSLHIYVHNRPWKIHC